MSRASWGAPVAAVAVACGGVVGVALLSTGDSARGAAPTTEDAPITAAPATAVTDASTTAGSPSPTEPVFGSGAEAREAAEGLIAAYIDSEFGSAVSDVACSVPETGAVGEQFACYALKPGDLVIALRATIGEERLIELELLLDQATATTTTPTDTAVATEG